MRATTRAPSTTSSTNSSSSYGLFLRPRVSCKPFSPTKGTNDAIFKRPLQRRADSPGAPRHGICFATDGDPNGDGAHGGRDWLFSHDVEVAQWFWRRRSRRLQRSAAALTDNLHGSITPSTATSCRRRAPGRRCWAVRTAPQRPGCKCGGMRRRRGRYREMHRVLFNSVARWAVPEGADDRLVDVARQAGLDPAGLRTCFASRRPLERVLQDLCDAQDLVRTLPRSYGSGTVKGA